MSVPKTTFQDGDIMEPEYANKIFRHIHDGVDEDGHVDKINLATSVTGILPLDNVAEIIASGVFNLTLTAHADSPSVVLQCKYTKFTSNLVTISFPWKGTGGVSNDTNFGGSWSTVGLPNLAPAANTLIPMTFSLWNSAFEDYVSGAGLVTNGGGGIIFLLATNDNGIIRYNPEGWPNTGNKRICQQTICYMAAE